jgi:F-type H+-transporting ATPase subunit b
MVTQQATGIMGALASLGIDWKLLLAQLFNVGVVVFIMWRWVYRPLLKVMDDRTKKIEQGLKDAEESAKLKSSAKDEGDRAILDARLKAKSIVEEATAAAAAQKDEAVKKAKTEVEKIVADGRDRLAEEKNRMLDEARKDILGLVVLATEKVLGEKIDAKKDEALLRKTLAEIRK